MSKSTTTPVLLLVELPDLARELADLNVNSVGAMMAEDPANAIATLGDGRVIVIAPDAPHVPGLSSWVNRISTSFPVLVLRQDEKTTGIAAPKIRELVAPVSISTLLGTVRIPDPDPQASANIFINPDFTVENLNITEVEVGDEVDPWANLDEEDHASPISSPAPSVDPWGDIDAEEEEEEPQAPQQAAPLTPLPSTANIQPPNVDAIHEGGESSQLLATRRSIHTSVPQKGAFPPPEAHSAVDVYDSGASPMSTPNSGGRLGQVLLVCAAKGGAAKTTTSRTIAQRAGAAGYRVVLIDANRGQAGQSVALRLARKDLPTIYDYALGGVGVDGIVLTPQRMAGVRGANLEQLNFSLVMSPPADIDDITAVTPAHYKDVIEALRPHVDLIVVDTQTIEVSTRHEMPMVYDLVIPQLTAGAWMLGLTSTDGESLEYMSVLLDKLISEQVFDLGASRAMIATSLVPEGFTHEVLQRLAGVWAGRATYAGYSRYSEELIGFANAGRVVWNHPSIRPLVDEVLLRVTGDQQFMSTAPEDDGKRKGRWWGRK